MARRQIDQLDTPDGEEGVGADEKGVGPLAHEGCEGRIDLAAGAGVEDLDLQPNARAQPLPRLSMWSRYCAALAGLTSTANASGRWHQLTQEFQPLCHQLADEKIDACQVAARPGEAGDKTKPDRVFADA